MFNNAGFIVLVETCIIIVIFLMYKKEKQTIEEKEKEYAEEINRMEEEIDLQNRRMTEEYAKIAKERNELTVEREKLAKEKAERTSLDNKTDQEIIRDIFVQNKKSEARLDSIEDHLLKVKDYSTTLQDIRSEIVHTQNLIEDLEEDLDQIDYNQIESIVENAVEDNTPDISVDVDDYTIRSIIEEAINDNMYRIESAVSSAVDSAMDSR